MKMKRALLLAGLAGLFYLVGGTALSLTNPDETFYTQTAREMVRHGEWMTPYLFDQPQFEKPILLYWLLRIAFIPFGMTAFAARFFPALFGILGVVAVYGLARAGFGNEKKAFGAGLVLMSGVLYAGMAKTVFTDMIFSVLILCSLMFFFLSHCQVMGKRAGILLCFVSAALAVLAKGPLGFAIPALAILLFLIIRRDMKYLFTREMLWGLILFLLIAVPWYALMMAKYGRSFTDEFFINDHWRRVLKAEHESNDTWFYYPLWMVAGLFPWSLFVAAAVVWFGRRLKPPADGFRVFLVCWIGAVLLSFQFAHSKLPSYILPLFPALALLPADFIWNDEEDRRTARVLHVLSVSTSVLLVALSACLCGAAIWYSIRVSPLGPPCFVVTSLSLIVSLLLSIVVARRQWPAGYAIAGCSFVLLILAPLPFLQYIEPYVSSKNACRYLLDRRTPSTTLLCSKLFVRGARYYTGRDIAVLGVNERNFFSPHPIPFLDSEEKVKAFLSTQPVTHAFLKKSDAEHIQDAIGSKFVCTQLAVVGNEYIVEIVQKTRLTSSMP